MYKACEVLEISPRTFSRWKEYPQGDCRKGAPKQVPRKLSETEYQSIVDICCSDTYKDCNPHEIVASLLDTGTYIASVSSFYRVLKAEGLLHYRSNSRKGIKKSAPPELQATGPHQVFSWDITYMKSPVRGIYFYCYMVLDIWSRKIVGWEVHDRESPEIAELLFSRLKRALQLSSVKLHSDNGGPMKGGSMLATLYSLGITPSFSRPRVSDDNPYSESLFKTLKYTAGYPKFFSTLQDARMWTADFVDWYNITHKHSGIGFITPEQRHTGAGEKILSKRNVLLLEAYAKHPERWSSSVKKWDYQKIVYLNPAVETKQEKITA